MSKSKRIVGPITTEYGTFQPGDQAIAITVCTSRVNVARVEYVGYVEHSGQMFAQVRRATTRSEWYDKDTGEATRWTPGRNLGIRYLPATVITTLQYNRLIPASVGVDALIEVI
jgi:hypothetical protein